MPENDNDNDNSDSNSPKLSLSDLKQRISDAIASARKTGDIYALTNIINETNLSHYPPNEQAAIQEALAQAENAKIQVLEADQGTREANQAHRQELAAAEESTREAEALRQQEVARIKDKYQGLCDDAA